MATMFEFSQLHFHSIGQVSINKAFGTNDIKVFPIEYRYGNEEVVVDRVNVLDILHKSNSGDDNLTATLSNSITATWLKFNSNRYIAPDVRRNDKVMILRLGNSDSYYWMDFNTANVKRLETVVYVWSADPDNPINEDLSNAYYLEISSHNKTITLHTSQANGEPYGYDIQLNTGDGFFAIQDTDTNEILLDSANTLIRMTNASKTRFELNKDVINGYAPKDINLTAGKTFSISCADYKLAASSSISTTTATHNGAASGGYTMDTPSASFTADVSVGGNIGVAGNMSAVGGISGKSLDAETGTIKSLSGTTLNYTNATFSSHGPH